MPDNSTTLSLQTEEPREPRRGGRTAFVALAALLVVLLAAAGFLGYEILRRTDALERQVARLSVKVDQAEAVSRQSLDRALAAEASAGTAAQARQQAEAQATLAREEAATARVQRPRAPSRWRRSAQVEADRIRRGPRPRSAGWRRPSGRSPKPDAPRSAW